MFPQQHHEFQDEQPQIDHAKSTSVEQTKDSDNKKRAPTNGYEFVLAILDWAEKNWFLIFLVLSILSLVLIELFGKN